VRAPRVRRAAGAVRRRCRVVRCIAIAAGRLVLVAIALHQLLRCRVARHSGLRQSLERHRARVQRVLVREVAAHTLGHV